jgi:hypothetical protein
MREAGEGRREHRKRQAGSALLQPAILGAGSDIRYFRASRYLREEA